MPTTSPPAPSYLPTCTVPKKFVPLPTLQTVPRSQPQRSRVEAKVKSKPIFKYGKK